MNGTVIAYGIFGIILGLLVLAIGSRSRDAMEIELGKFKAPVWFLLLVFGIIIAAIGLYI